MQDILVAGDPKIAIIDANDNGSLTDADDCVLGAQSDGSDLLINGDQADGPNKLRVCDGTCDGSGMVSSGFAETAIDSCEFAGAPFVPLLAEFCSTLASCLSTTPSSASRPAAGGAAGQGAPVQLTAGVIYRTFMGLEQVGSGQVCSAGGPAVQVTGDDGITVLRSMFPFPPNAPTPTHMCIPNIPVQLVSGGFVMRTGCFPVTHNTAPLALSDTPNTPFAVINLGALQSCAGSAGAPTASTWGLFALILALLAGGTWMLARRRGFADSLPLA